MAKILVVEDDQSTLDALKQLLTSERHSVDCVESADRAIDFVRTYQYDLFIVDWEMPGMTGIEFVRKFRDNGGAAPIIMLTGKSATDEKVSGLDSGADYYLTKPFDSKALLSFIRAGLRRSPQIVSDVIAFGNLQLKPSSAEVVCEGQSVTLSNKEAAVLKLFMQHSDRIISHQEIESAGWSGSTVSPGTLRTFLTSLREKLQSIGATIKILNVRGYGYRIE